MAKSLTKQINSVYFYSFFTGMMFWYGIEQLFLEQISEGLFARGVVIAVFSATILLATIPIGALSDVWGRLRSLKVGIVLMLCSLVTLGLADSLVIYSIGSILFGLFWAFDEGAKEAFVYDSLADAGKTKLYQKTLGRIYAVQLIGAAIANFLSGFIAQAASLRFTFWLSIASAIVAGYFLLQLHEPEHHRQVGKKILHQLNDAINVSWRSKTVLYMVIIMTLILTASIVLGEFAQPVIVEFTSDAVLLGILWGLLGLLMAFGNLIAHKIYRPGLLLTTIAVLVLVYFVTSSLWWSLSGLFMAIVFLESAIIIGNEALQKVTPTELRASISSIPGAFSMAFTTVLALMIVTLSGSLALKLTVIAIPMMLVSIFLWARLQGKIAQPLR